MPQLLNLDDTPLTWPEAHTRAARYWETHEQDRSLKVAPLAPTCGNCRHGRHRKCSGWMLGVVVVSGVRRYSKTACPCECH